jgi:ethanolamine ammonia-lyase large subunit
MTREELRAAFVLASEFKEGDAPLGATRDASLRADARRGIASLHLREIGAHSILEDGVSEVLARSLDRAAAAETGSMTVADVVRTLLESGGPRWAERHRDGLSSEAIACVVKLMNDDQLASLAGSLHNPASGGGLVVGAPGHLGSRIQPNSAGDDEEEILFSIFEGLAYGCGDVMLGLNPASDDLDTIVRLEELLATVVERLELPTRFCVLSDIVKQTSARARTRVDVGFQSLAGTSKALAGMVGLDVDGIAELADGFDGLYFETGQGSEVTNGAAAGIDMVTLESRTHGVARAILRRAQEKRSGPPWMIVNDVAGFIGPEVFRTAQQLERACLEDLVMAKLHGLTMGLDVCSTFHMGIEPNELRRVTESITRRGAPAYLMAVAGNSDPMLGYLTTSFRDHPRLRRKTGARIASAMEKRLAALGVDSRPPISPSGAARLYAAYVKAAGDSRSVGALADEASRKVAVLRDRGFDLGYGQGADLADPEPSALRLERLYAHARRALYATLAPSVVADACPRRLPIDTLARDRDEYLAHPPSGERIRDADSAMVAALYSERRPTVQVVVSDGLNADAVNENLRSLLPSLRRALAAADRAVGDVVIVVRNARVRAGYHVGALLDVDAIVHLIGERPGTGLNTLSAYLTYGRDTSGRSRWSPNLDHAATTAICGIHRHGKPPDVAAPEIARTVLRMLEERRSGVGA